MTYTCPCCGGFIGEAAPIEDVSAAIRSPWQLTIFNTLAKSRGKPVLRNRLFSAVYDASRDGGPATAYTSLSIVISNTRRSIERYGWTIVSKTGGRGNLATYTLTPLEAGA